MTRQQLQFGKENESLAASYLERKGYRVIDRNHRNRFGEIDIIAKDGDTLVFIEVKARRSNRYGSAKMAVTRNKRRTLSRTALQYLKSHGLMHQKARFDVVAIHWGGHPVNVEVVRNAFELGS